MPVLVAYSTTDGHTRDVCKFLTTSLRASGHTVQLLEVGVDQPQPDLLAFDAFLLAASLHVGRYQAATVHFARANRDLLNSRPSAFISLSLSAAGMNPHDWEGLDRCVDRLLKQTHWLPRAIHHAGGAIKNSRYDFFKSVVLQFIASQHGQKTARTQDYDFTDYEALKSFAIEFLREAEQPDPRPASVVHRRIAPNLTQPTPLLSGAHNGFWP